MSLNSGKEKRKTFHFLGHDLFIDKIPAGCAIPFSIEVDKVRAMALKGAEAIAQVADERDQIEELTIKYYSDPVHQAEAHEMSLQTVKAISVFTEYVTNGKVNEEYILHNADMEEVNEFMIQIQEAINAPLKKHLANLIKKEE